MMIRKRYQYGMRITLSTGDLHPLNKQSFHHANNNPERALGDVRAGPKEDSIGNRKGGLSNKYFSRISINTHTLIPCPMKRLAADLKGQ